MKNEMPESVTQALRYLIQTAAEAKIVVCGFAFGVEPACITSFGNCPDKADIKLYQFLCELAKDKQREGMVLIDRVQKPA